MYKGTKGVRLSRIHKEQVNNPQREGSRRLQRIEYMLSKEKIAQICQQLESQKRSNVVSNSQMLRSNQKISLSQKQMIIEIEIQKRMTLLKFNRLKEHLKSLENLKNNEIPEQVVKKQQDQNVRQEIQLRKKQKKKEDNMRREEQVEYEISKLKRLNNLIEKVMQEVRDKKQNYLRLRDQRQEQVKNLNQSIVNQQQEMKEIYEEKKKQNNNLQQQKGNIRVYCRLRPSNNERIDYEITDNLIKLKRDKTELKSKNRTDEYEYLFEKTFGEDTSQQVIFDELSELVQCSVDGKNVCIFAYGQTGSGKTFTMTGSLDKYSHQLRGFIPRSIDYIFNQVQIATQKGYNCKINVSICEVYNDKISDLLSKEENRLNSQAKSNSKSLDKSSSKKQLTNQKALHDLVYTEVKNFNEAMLVLSNALRHRTTAETKMNTQSSRSHLIFEIKNQFHNEQSKISRSSSLVLVDLAGSQRQKDSGVTGLRLEEAKSINNSLTELGKVIRAIKNGGLATFRNCKLTMILQQYLEGDSKAVMFVNVSPDKKDLDQTVNSLVFAESVRQCIIKNNKRVSSLSF